MKIVVQIPDGPPRTIAALVDDGIALHRSIDMDMHGPWYTVTHIASGMMMHATPDWRVAKHLWREAARRRWGRKTVIQLLMINNFRRKIDTICCRFDVKATKKG